MRRPIKNHWIAGLTAIAGSLIQINTDILSEELFSINSIPRQIMIYSAVYVLIFLANEAGERKHVNMPVSRGGGY